MGSYNIFLYELNVFVSIDIGRWFKQLTGVLGVLIHRFKRNSPANQIQVLAMAMDNAADSSFPCAMT